MADNQTLRFYQHNANEIFARYESVKSPLSSLFAECFGSQSTVLDIGCGSGRDVMALLATGYDAYGVEPCDELRTLCVTAHPELDNRIQSGQLPSLPVANQFDGILCCAVLMHLPAKDHLAALQNIRAIQPYGGRFLISVPAKREDVDEHNRDQHHRLFEPIYEDRLIQQAQKAHYKLLKRFSNDDALGRSGVSWLTLLFEAV